MLPALDGSTQKYLADLDRLQTAINQAQSEVSSGLRVTKPSDAPSSLAGLLQTQIDIAQNKRIQANFTELQTELAMADSGLQSAIGLIDRATVLATQGAGALLSANDRAGLAEEVASIQQQLVGISGSVVNGSYIFGGSQDGQAPYVLDATQTYGVRQVSSAPATRVLQDVNGISVTTSMTAQEIFDAKDADGVPVSGNVFSAVDALTKALRANDIPGIQAAAAALKTAGSHLNEQAEFYGAAQTRVIQAINQAKKFQIQEETILSNIRDADLTEAALRLDQGSLHQQAALAVRSKTSKLSLFDYLA
jgi:flagellar hook-associated protein 3 FlgL